MIETKANRRDACADTASTDRIQTVQRAARDLAEALGAVLAKLPERRDGNVLARELNLDANLPRRVLAALGKSNPLELIHALPRAEGMRLFLDAAARHAPPEAVARARSASAAVHELVRREVGNADRLARIVAATDAMARKALERRAKRTLYKGACEYYGHHIRVRLAAFIVRNSPVHAERCELATVAGAVGLEQCGSVVPVPMTMAYKQDEMPSGTNFARLCDLSGAPLCADNHFGAIPEFSSRPFPEFAEFDVAGQSMLGLAPSALGFGDTLDYFFGFLDRELNVPRFAGQSEGGQVLSIVPTSPCARLVLESYVHRDTWPTVTPELGLHRIGSRPPVIGATFDRREIDRFSVQETVQSLGYGIPPRVKDMPQYPTLMRHCFDSLGWPADEFAVYRCAIEFPVIGVQVAMRFLPPAAGV